MPRILVEEGGKRRLFRVQRDAFSVGRDPASNAVPIAEEGALPVHCRFEQTAEGWVLEDLGGPIGTRVNGSPVRRHALRPGDAIEVGGARLVFEPPIPAPAATAGVPPPPASAPPAPTAPAAAAPAPPPTPERPPAPRRAERPSAPRAAPAAALRSAARDRRMAVARRGGLPPWATALLATAGLVVVLLLGARMISRAGIRSALGRAQGYLETKEYDKAIEELARIDASDASVRADVARIRGEIDKRLGDERRAKDEVEGDRLWGATLERFERQSLETPTRPAARVFLKRLDAFAGRFPEHSKMGWVREKRAKYAPVANLDDPPTWEDVEFEVKAYTWAETKDYRKARLALEHFLRANDRTAPGAKARNAMKALDEECAEYFETKYAEARKAAEAGQIVLALTILDHLAEDTGVEELAARAASARADLQRQTGRAPG